MNILVQKETSNPDLLKKDIKSNNHVKVLWTGGLDSTFRMIELSRESVTIRPYYLCDKRNSERQELNAISLIMEDINNHPETKCTILPLIKVKVAELKPDEEINKAYRRLYLATNLGSQFEWLARFAKSVPGIELSIEKSNKGKAYKCMRTFGSIKLEKKGNLSYYYIDKNHSSEDIIKVFGNFHFPYHLFHITKSQEYELYIKKGFEKTLVKTWFCHTPINNKPCGVCHPCKSIIEEQLSYRLTPSALKRHNLHEKSGESSVYVRLFNLRTKIKKLFLVLHK